MIRHARRFVMDQDLSNVPSVQKVTLEVNMGCAKVTNNTFLIGSEIL